MSKASNYLENKLADHILGVTSFTMPSVVYLSLHTSDPGEAASGAEVATGGYARQSVGFTAASAGTCYTASTKSYAASGASFGTITHFGIWDAASSGNLLVYGAFDSSAVINDGDTFVVSAGNLSVQVL